jgi:mRNA-degrading endonuclease RelE of RelBE toxin-antitoxin system
MRVVLSREAEKDYSGLPKSEQRKIDRKLLYLSKDPFVGKLLSGELKGYYSLKAWPYRIIYQIIKKSLCVAVIRILHRQGAYK